MKNTENQTPNEPLDKEGAKKETIADRERATQKKWKESSIFEKTLDQTRNKEPYIFYDGPPFATGLPHYGHLLAGTIKDVVPRFQSMRGRYVRREWGWDCHGLPVENLIEGELGFKTKKDIEEYGIGNFNEKARSSVMLYDKEWHQIVPRVGRWVDMDKSYKTMDANYTESIWWAFKTLHDKGLIYEGFKAMHICPRCETTLAISEVGMNYKDTKDISVYVKFELTDEPETFFLAWTTTPWTLPGNVALAVGEGIEYVKMQFHTGDVAGQTFIVAKERMEEVFQKASISLEEDGKPTYDSSVISGRDLVGLAYKPIFDTYANDKTLDNHVNGWKVCGADFVTTESGTGIVHIAPAFGEDDMELGKKEKLPFVQHVGMDGKISTLLAEFAGLSVKPKSDDDKTRLSTDIAVLQYLQKHRVFFAKENIVHPYPYCWRCETPLLNYASSSWFVDVTKLKPRLIEENKEIGWTPEHMQQGRFGKWLEGARDWAISRSRYWGAPIPVWRCNKCGHLESHGSVESLKQKLSSGNTYTILRHGEAETNVKGIVSYKPSDSYSLTERGKTQIKSAVVKLKAKKIDLIIASPILRTKETARIVAEALGLSDDAIVFDERISEVNTGTFSGCPIDEYREYFVDTLEKFTKAPPEGETLTEMKQRVGEFLYDIDVNYHRKNILFVTHEYVAWLMQAVSKGATNEEASWMRLEGGEDFIGNGETLDLSFSPIPHNALFELDLHRPFIDEQTSYKCTCELGLMKRVLEVFDCWFESGSMPFAQFHYMGDERTQEGKLFMKNFPADFIAEGIDQTRGWFYTLLILSVGLFDRAPYKNVIVNGMILAEDGQKMAKKLRNYPDPMEVVEKYGADALRYYLLSSPAVRGEDLRFSLSGVDEVYKKITLRIDNIRTFYELFGGDVVITSDTPKSDSILDRWILARWFETHAEVTHYLDTHELDRATRLLAPFLDDLSTWYIRRSRDRFKSDDIADRDSARKTTGWVLMQLSKLIAPFMPYLADELYGRINIEAQKESVHLESWPETSVAASTILDDMEETRRVVSLALEARAKAGIKVRQPLSVLKSGAESLKGKEELLSIITEEVNVKRIEIVSGLEGVFLDTAITPELEAEGKLRDLLRSIQDLRKQKGLVPEDKIKLTISGDSTLEEILLENKNELSKIANVIEVTKADIQEVTPLVISGASIVIVISKA